MNVLWFSAGVSSAVVSYICKDELDAIIYQHIDDQHPDTLRFVHDMERFLGKEIEIRQSPMLSVENACRMGNCIRIPGRPPQCSTFLKRRERKEWELEHPGRHTYYWGLDCAERNRANSIVRSMPDYDHRFPLIELDMTKADAHGLLAMLGIKRPAMYDLGYHNNNCIGCVSGGKGYWNKIRVDFPDVFEARAKMERVLGHSCINGVYLDELPPDAGRHEPPIEQECSIYCLLADNVGKHWR